MGPRTTMFAHRLSLQLLLLLLVSRLVELSVVEKPEGTIFHNNIQVDTASGRGVYSPQQLKRLDSILRWPELKQATQDVKQQYDLSQPVCSPWRRGHPRTTMFARRL